MADKIIPIDPKKRLTKEVIDDIKARLDKFDLADSSFIMIYTDKDGGACCDGFGIDWALLGIAEAYLEDLRSNLLNDDFTDDE